MIKLADSLCRYKDRQALGHTFLAACTAAISALGIRLFPDEEGSSLSTACLKPCMTEIYLHCLMRASQIIICQCARAYSGE